MSQAQQQDASVQLARLAQSEDWATWSRPALDKLATEIGVDTAVLPGKPEVVEAIRSRIAEHARATVPAAPTATAKTYRVTGPHRVMGARRGQKFTHVFTPEQEAALIGGGHIEIEGEPHG